MVSRCLRNSSGLAGQFFAFGDAIDRRRKDESGGGVAKAKAWL
jgi:hypothetical protein